MTDETTTEQLAEIEEQAADTPATEYTPPEGWRVLAVGEKLQPGDMSVRSDGYCSSTERVGYYVGLNRRYIRRIEPEPQPEPVPVQVREGRWRTRGGDIRNVTPRPAGDGRKDLFPWWDAAYGGTWTSGGRYYFGEESPLDLDEYLGPIEPQAEPQPEPVQVPDADESIRLLKQANDSQAETIGRLLTEARDLNMEIGGLERRLSERQARIRDLETMHAAATQAVVDAGKQNDTLRLQVESRQQEYEKQKRRIEFLETINSGNNSAIRDYKAQVEKLQGLVDTARAQLETAATEHDSLRLQLAAVKAELVTQAETSRRLQIELDAAQQVPADSPELRQLRADLAEVGHDRDMYRHEHELLVQNIDATHQRTKAETVEAIAEWLEPIRREDPHLRAVILFHLPKIIRSLAGLNTPEDVD